jgi:hypothetical protein
MRIKSERKNNVDSSFSFSKRASHFSLVIILHIYQLILLSSIILIQLRNSYYMLRCRVPEVPHIAFSDKDHYNSSLPSFPLLTSPLFFTIDERRGKETREDRVNAACK